MLVINYNGNKPTTDYYKFSVQGNNNADIIRFLVALNQGGLVFHDEYTIYAKVQCVDDDYYDKVRLDAIEFDVSNNLLKADFILKAQQTSHKQIEMSLCCENLDEEIVWQTQIAKVAIANGINADEEVADQYPSIIQDLQRQINELKAQGGGSNDVLIKRVYLTYQDKISIRYGVVISTFNDVGFTNDSSRIWVNFETTSINSKIEEEIKAGRFIIRLDYPIRNKGANNIRLRDNDLGLKRATNHRNCGMGYRAFAHSFNELSDNKKTLLLNSLIFVGENDIRTNNYGEKYIHKKIRYIDLINKMCWFEGSDSVSAITNNMLVNTDWGQMLCGELENKFMRGIPAIYVIGDDGNKNLFMGRARAKTYQQNSIILSFDSNGLKNINNSIKLNPTFNCYAITSINSWEKRYGALMLVSPYLTTKRKELFFLDFNEDYVIGWYSQHEGKVVSPACKSRPYMVARPRCAILNNDYETSNEAFVKTYPQSEQQIRLVCKNIQPFEEEFDCYMPIFRVLITPK